MWRPNDLNMYYRIEHSLQYGFKNTEVKNEVYVPSGKNIINDSPWPPDFEPTVKEMRFKLYEFGGKREGIDEPPREEMRKLRQYYAVKFRSWLKDGNRDMSQLLCHYYAVAKMSNRCWERAVSIMEKYRLGLLKDMSKGLPVKQSIFQFVDRGNEEYTYDIMCKVERGEVSLQEAKQKYRMILDKRKAKINTAKRLSTIEAMNHDQEAEQSRRRSIDYEQRPSTVVNGGGYHVEQNDLPEDYREHGGRPMDSGHIDRYPQSPSQTMIKQERLETAEGGVKSTEIRALNGVVAKHYNGLQYHEYNQMQKVGEREYEMDKLKKRLRDVEDERDGMEKKWLDQVQNHVKEKYLIADLQKEVLLWKGKFKNLLDRIQGLECDARRDFDFSCRRASHGDTQNDFISQKHKDQGSVVRAVDSGVEKVSVIDAPGRIVHVPVTCGVPVIARDRGGVPQVYRPEPTYIYGYPSQAIHHPTLVQNGVTPMITSEYYDARRDVTMATPEVSREQVTIATSDEADDKDVDVDVEGKADDQEESGDNDMSKRLVIGTNKAKIIVRKRNDPSRYVAGAQNKRKRLSR
ncbi:uncharacterized protein LOC114528732 isoform X2 [Dendronephthya gigantea]|uniref:uncharacterized protein LOC114528732 isoform X2 n=1 Tax=Dendronephthya gigantea TaxID=151771 RepID=UPI00106D4DD7|nr:uncharacterized protein LOC114528732 isoform X2 [Dendronephthya gigantea]